MIYGGIRGIYGDIRGYTQYKVSIAYIGYTGIYGWYTGGMRVVYGWYTGVKVIWWVFQTQSFVLCIFFLWVYPPKILLNLFFDYFCKYHDGRGLGKKWCLFDHLGDRKRITSWWHMNWHNLWKQNVRWWWLLCISFEFLWVLCSCQHWPT